MDLRTDMISEKVIIVVVAGHDGTRNGEQRWHAHVLAMKSKSKFAKRPWGTWMYVTTVFAYASL